jgi:hypothetical protein
LVTRNEERYRINEHQFMLAEKKNCSRIVWLTRHRDGCQWTESESNQLPLRNAFLIQGHFRSRSTRVVFPDLLQKRTTWVEDLLVENRKVLSYTNTTRMKQIWNFPATHRYGAHYKRIVARLFVLRNHHLSLKKVFSK